ncbi:MAG: FG-GAP repeat protein [Phycisphaerales bacterium]
MDIHGDLVVTGPGYRHSPRHIVRCFRKNLHAWSEEAALVATDGGPLDSFGASVAAFDNVVAVGAPHHGDAGAVYIFRFRRGVWTQEAKLIPSDLHDEAGFGLSVEIERDVLVVGAPYGPADHETGGSTGSVFIFRLRDGVWIEETRIRGSSAFRDSRFGYSVALSNDALLVGAPTSNDGPPWRGHAYLFQFQGNSWVERARLASPDQPWAEDYFGRTVALATDTALVGAPYYDPWRPHVRSAYLFRLGETPRISVDGSCPAGESATIDWTCATPHGRVALLYSARSRSLVIPDRYPCHGAALGLSGPRLHLVSSELWSDENGAGSLEGFIPDAACGGFLQLIDLETCAVSNVARIE